MKLSVAPVIACWQYLTPPTSQLMLKWAKRWSVRWSGGGPSEAWLLTVTLFGLFSFLRLLKS